MLKMQDVLFCLPMRDRRNKQQKRRDEKRDPVTGQSEYEKIIAGEVEPVGIQKGWLNLQPIPINQRPAEERKKICRKGAQAVNKIRGEEKSAKESLDRMLAVLATDEILNSADVETALLERLKRDNPNMTVYDAINAAAIGRALSGSVSAMSYVRDTRGDKPAEKHEISADIMTDQDRELMKSIADRLGQADEVLIVKDDKKD